MAAVADVGAAFGAKPPPEAAVDAPGAALVAGPAVRVEPGLIITPPQTRHGGAVLPSGSMGSWQMGHSGTTWKDLAESGW